MFDFMTGTCRLIEICIWTAFGLMGWTLNMPVLSSSSARMEGLLVLNALKKGKRVKEPAPYVQYVPDFSYTQDINSFQMKFFKEDNAMTQLQDNITWKNGNLHQHMM